MPRGVFNTDNAPVGFKHWQCLVGLNTGNVYRGLNTGNAPVGFLTLLMPRWGLYTGDVGWGLNTGNARMG